MKARMWAIVTPNNRIEKSTTKPTRTEAIYKFVGSHRELSDWKYARTKGYRCVRVTVTAEEGR